MISQTRRPNHVIAGLLGVYPLLILPNMAESNAAPESRTKRSPITVHVLDTMLGKPGTGLAVVLERRSDPGWKELARGRTDDSGRIESLLEPGTPLPAGIYRITYHRLVNCLVVLLTFLREATCDAVMVAPMLARAGVE